MARSNTATLTFLLDTNVISSLFRENRSVVANLRRRPAPSVETSSVVLMELWAGALRLSAPVNLVDFIKALKFAVLPFEEADAICAAEVKAQLERLGTPISAYDTLIAGQALARDLTLVSHNTREFARVPGLRLEDWEA